MALSHEDGRDARSPDVLAQRFQVQLQIGMENVGEHPAIYLGEQIQGTVGAANVIEPIANDALVQARAAAEWTRAQALLYALRLGIKAAAPSFPDR